MILINGRIVENKNQVEAIERIRLQILDTLCKPILEPEVVIRATDCLIKDISNGRYDVELAQVVANQLGFQEEKNQVLKDFHKTQLMEKYELELGQWKSKVEADSKGRLRVMPLGTLLHIAAGNMEVLPVFSVLEGLLSGNINLLKLPSTDQGLSILLLQKLMEYEPILKEYIYVFDTPSSDFATIQLLMELANGIVVWGGDEAVQAVRTYAPVNTKLIEWGHKLSFVYLSDLNVPHEMLVALAKHLLETKQLLCSSCQVIYLNTSDFKVVKQFGKEFATILGQLDKDYEIPQAVQGKITIELLTRTYEQLGKNESLDVIYRNQSSSVICRNDSILELSMLYGNVLIKPLPEKEILTNLSHNRGHLQTVGVYPKNEETILQFLRLGVTNIIGLDQMSATKLYRAHDGMFPLQVYSRIVEC